MTETFYRTPHYTPDPTKFGGIINLSDFYTNCGGHLNTHGSLIAQHIISDWKFDWHCSQNIKMRQKGDNHKNNNWRKKNVKVWK